ncbi:MAG: glutamate formimidoyltransferase [Clostridia bacterium]|nr:glutamate formimidoyltransferase [Clostridia bacterium]
MEKILVCAPNYSEYKNRDVVEKILDCFRGRENVVLASWEGDENHNRFSPSIMGEPDAVRDAMLDSMRVATELIDMNKHKGQHPRMGATDIIPFTPLKNITLEECCETARQLGEMAAEQLNIPIFMYADTATAPDRVKLANIRKGEYEGLAEKLKDPHWKPDYGPAAPHPTAGATAICARGIHLVPINVVLNTTDLSIAKAIAKKVRYSSGGYRSVEAIGVDMPNRGQVSVSMDIFDFKQTSPATVVETVRALAATYGVTVGSVQIGLVPMEIILSVVQDLWHLEYLDDTPFTKEMIFESFLV